MHKSQHEWILQTLTVRKNGTGNNGTGDNGKNSNIGKNSIFSIFIGFRVGLSIWDGGLGWGMGV